jgi:type II secretory pathway pseudopilin PulG
MGADADMCYRRQMMTIQARELEALQAKIRAAEQRLQQRKSRDGSPSGRHESASHREKTGRSQDPGPHDDNEKARAQSPLSSALSDGHRSDGGFTDSSTSAATSNDFDEAEEEEDDSKGKARQS